MSCPGSRYHRKGGPGQGSLKRRRHRHHRSEPLPVHEALDGWIRRKGLSREFLQYSVWLRWSELVGEHLARRTQPHTLDGDTLVVRVASSAWLNELNFMKHDLLRSINAGLGKQVVRQLRLRVGPIRPAVAQTPAPPRAAAPTVRPRLQRKVSLDEERRLRLETARVVSDPRLREAIVAARLAALRWPGDGPGAGGDPRP